MGEYARSERQANESRAGVRSERLAVLAAIVAILAGCAEQRTVWVKPGATDDDFLAGIEICTRRARIVVHESERGRVVTMDRDAYAQCLRQFGYRRRAAP